MMRRTKILYLLVVFLIISSAVESVVLIRRGFTIERLRTNYRNAALEYQLWHASKDNREIQHWKDRARQQSSRIMMLENTNAALQYDQQDCAVRYSAMDYSPDNIKMTGRDNYFYYVAWAVGTRLPDRWHRNDSKAKGPRDAREILCTTAKQRRTWIGTVLETK